MPGLEPGALTGVGVRIPPGAQRWIANHLSLTLRGSIPSGVSVGRLILVVVAQVNQLPNVLVVKQ